MGSDGAAIAADPSIAMDSYFVPQGYLADIIATEYGFTRDDADCLALNPSAVPKWLGTTDRFAKSVISVNDSERSDDP